jgi:hypothetical protein
MLSKKEQSIRKSVDLMFKGLDDDTLKEVILAIALNKTQEEKDAIAEQIRLKNEADYAEKMKMFEIEVSSESLNESTNEVPELTTESQVIINGED